MNKLSGGQQRRLDVAVALAGDPDLLFLDEPTTGFDPNARRNAWEIVKNLTALGKTVFLTTHFMDEAQYLADRVAVIARGRDRRRGAARHDRGARPHDRADPVPRCRRARRSLPDWGQVDTGDGYLELTTDDPTRTLHTVTGWAIEHDLAFETIEAERPSLEDVYLSSRAARRAPDERRRPPSSGSSGSRTRPSGGTRHRPSSRSRSR